MTLLLGASASGQTVGVQTIDIHRYGIYAVGERVRIADPNAPGGRTEDIPDYRLTETTTTILARRGTSFGVEYLVAGQPDRAKVTIREIVRFPAPGLHDPQSGKDFAWFEYDRIIGIGGGAVSTYGFDYDWETIPGPWIFEYWYGGRKLAEKTFSVIPP